MEGWKRGGWKDGFRLRFLNARGIWVSTPQIADYTDDAENAEKEKVAKIYAFFVRESRISAENAEDADCKMCNNLFGN